MTEQEHNADSDAPTKACSDRQPHGPHVWIGFPPDVWLCLGKAILTESDRGRIKDLIERSSLGTPEAKALRATVSDEHAARIVALAKELETAEGVCDCALSLVGEHENSCLHERLGRVERLLIELTRHTSPERSKDD